MTHGREEEVAFVATGLDGSNPLGFLAALGVLSALDQQRAAEDPRPRLYWTLSGHWQPTFVGVQDIDAAAHAVMEDKASWADDPSLLLAYDENGSLVDPRHVDKCTRDLKPPPASMRAYLSSIAEYASAANADTFTHHRRTAAMVAAYGSELVQDNNGNTKPMALHFTAGQQRFLDAVARLQAGVTHDDVREALLGPWSGSSALPSMSWDSTVSRNYALRAGDPSKEKRGSNPGADWLAFIGLSFTTAVAKGHRLLTKGVRGGWKDSTFTWPLWTTPAAAALIPAVLSMGDPAELSPMVRKARGIGAVMRCDITRSDQGGYGGFSPSAVA